MIHFIRSSGRFVNAFPKLKLTLLFTAINLFFITLANAQTKEEQAAIERLVRYSYLSGAGVTEGYIEKVSKEIPEAMRKEWALYPELRKLSYAFMAAEQANAGSGEKLLALLSQALAEEYEAILSETALKMYIEMPVNLGKDAIRFAALPIGTEITLQANTKTSLLKLSKYTDQGALGSMQSILYHYYGLEDDAVFGALNSSKTNLEALERGLAISNVPPEHSERIRRMVKDIIDEFPNLKDEKELAALIDSPVVIDPSDPTKPVVIDPSDPTKPVVIDPSDPTKPVVIDLSDPTKPVDENTNSSKTKSPGSGNRKLPIDPATHQKVMAENLALKKQITDKISNIDIVLPSEKEILDELYVTNEAEAKKKLKLYGYDIPENQSLTSYIRNLEKKELGKMLTSEARTANIFEFNDKLKANSSLLTKVRSNFDVLVMGEKALRVGPCSRGATICIRCALPCVFPICLSRRR